MFYIIVHILICSNIRFQNGVSAPHMLGNQLNPTSTMAQKMSDTLSQELEAHSIFTEASNSTTNLVGPQLHSRVIASVGVLKIKYNRDFEILHFNNDTYFIDTIQSIRCTAHVIFFSF